MVDRATVEKLREYSTPTILNGLKRLGVTPDRMQSSDRHIARCMSPELGISCGFAVTRKMSTRRDGGPSRILDAAPDQGLLAVGGPRFLAVENVGDWQGPVCIWGDVTSNIHTALDCHAGITNGPVRDLPEMAAMGFQSFANGTDVGGGFVDLMEINGTVNVAGLEVRPGDLLHGDQHGVIKIPLELAARLPEAIAAHIAWEDGIAAACKAEPFDLDALAAAMKPKG